MNVIWKMIDITTEIKRKNIWNYSIPTANDNVNRFRLVRIGPAFNDADVFSNRVLITVHQNNALCAAIELHCMSYL